MIAKMFDSLLWFLLVKLLTERKAEMKIELATDKIAKYASRESGDSFEVVERPRGGITGILADAQGSGFSAKLTSNMVAAKAANLIADGTRDGAVARATHDFLYAQRRGRVSSTLTLFSCDLATETLVISRNSNCPTLIYSQGNVDIMEEPVKPIGFHYFVKPSIHEIQLAPNMVLLSFSDGIYHAGKNFGQQFPLNELIQLLREYGLENIGRLSEQVLNHAVKRDKDRPQDDMSVMAMGVFSGVEAHKPRKVRVTYTY